MGTINTEQIDGLTGMAPVYRHFAGQTQPQPAYIEMDEDGNVSAGYNAEVGNAVRGDVWHGVTLRWGIPNTLTAQGIRELVEVYSDELQRVHDGHEIIWRDTNRVGRLTSDAEAACDELHRAFGAASDAYECSEVWDASEWFYYDREGVLQTLGITIDSTPEEIKAAIERYETEMEADRIVIENLDEHVDERIKLERERLG